MEISASYKLEKSNGGSKLTRQGDVVAEYINKQRQSVLETAMKSLMRQKFEALFKPEIVSDGLGGVIAAWQDSRGGSLDIYARRINGSGVPQWAANGVAAEAEPNRESVVVATLDLDRLHENRENGAAPTFRDRRRRAGLYRSWPSHVR